MHIHIEIGAWTLTNQPPPQPPSMTEHLQYPDRVESHGPIGFDPDPLGTGLHPHQDKARAHHQ